jgi:Dihydroorotate dehydrogenase
MSLASISGIPSGLAPVLERQVDLLDECDGIGFCFTGIIPGETPVETVAARLQARTSPIIASVELRAEGDEEEKAQRALIRQYSLLYDFTDYFVIDINRESGLTSLDDLSDWTPLLDEVLNLRLCYEKYRPILLRIAPGHTEEQMARILDFCLMSGFDGVVAPGIAKVRFCAEYTKNRLPIIGSGAITTAEEAIALLQAGASLIEVAHGPKNRGLSSAKRLLQAIDNPQKQS